MLDKCGYYSQTKKTETPSPQPGPKGSFSSKPPSPPPPPTGPNPAKVPCVQVLDASGAIIETRFLSGAGVTLGSAPVSDMILRSAQVSEKHVRLEWDGHHVTVTDLGSAGTLLDNHALLPQIGQLWMKDKWLRVGPYFIWLHTAGESNAPRTMIDVVLDQVGRNMTLIPPDSSCP